MKFSDVENKSVAELIKQKSELTAKIFEMGMKNKLGQLATPHLIRNARRDIARLNTAITRKAAR